MYLIYVLSGTAAGSQFGVAKAANLIAVKVLSDQGYVSINTILDWSDGRYLGPVPSPICMFFETFYLYAGKMTASSYSVSGLNFVLNTARSSGRPSIATLSLGGSASTALDNAIASVRPSIKIASSIFSPQLSSGYRRRYSCHCESFSASIYTPPLSYRS